MSLSSQVERHLAERELRMPASLRKLYDSDLPSKLGDALYRPSSSSSAEFGTIEWAEDQIDQSKWPLLPNLVPIMAVDEQSFACVIASDVTGAKLPFEGRVVRWHVELDDRYQDFQAGLLDVDCYLYAESVQEELAHREQGWELVFERIGPAYEKAYIDKSERPRDHVVRPIRLACQNVIVGLAAIAQDSSFDGLSVVAWQTCERPHVATHEANRALAVVTLCDAFQNGGTMEIRFDRPSRLRDGVTPDPVAHPEQAVPASLRRYARTLGVTLGGKKRENGKPPDPYFAAITPTQARDLFRAITPMPDGLRARVDRAEHELGVTPERLCYMLLKPVWRDIELDYLLATTDRVVSILEGGAEWTSRAERQAETEACRGAIMAGMLYRRLNSTDLAGADGEVRLIEASTVGVQWECLEELGAVRFTNMAPGAAVPWLRGAWVELHDSLLVFPRALATDELLETARHHAQEEPTALVVPEDLEIPTVPDGVKLLRCPDRLADIDKATEQKLLDARTSRG
jgi:hypothetical protein